jgi:hypothetical protein
MVRSTLADALRFHEARNREDRKKAAIDSPGVQAISPEMAIYVET